MSTINDLISSTAASNPYVGGAIASGSVQAELLSTLNPSSAASSLTSLIAAANSEAALNPAALYTPSAALTSAMNSASLAEASALAAPAVAAASAQAGAEAQLLDSLGGMLNISA